MTACGGSASSTAAASTSEAASAAAQSEAASTSAVAEENSASSEAASGQAEDAKVKAEFTVTGADGESQTFTLEVTDGEKLSDALVEAGLISEEEAAAGFLTTVNGETADYDADGTYWGLYINGEYAMTGVDATTLEAGATYAFRVEKVEG